jgi:hypothetical protein
MSHVLVGMPWHGFANRCEQQTLAPMQPRIIVPSLHAVQRAYERGITTPMIQDTLRWGKKLHRQGMCFHVMLRRCIPPGLEERYAKRLVNVTVVLAADETIVTVYRNPKAIAHIKRKPKRLL